MNKYIQIIFFTFLTSSSLYAQKKTPKTLIETFEYFNKKWSKKEIQVFKEKPDSIASTTLHFSTGMWIRNNWIRNGKDTTLVSYFNSMGIYHPDDISSIILTSYHRNLNGQDLNLDKQVKRYIEYWDVITKRENLITENALVNYNKYHINDTITFTMLVDIQENGEKNAVVRSGAWKFDPSKDLMVKCFIDDKFNRNSISNVFFKLHIIDLNQKGTKILMKEVKVGDIIEMPVRYLTIKN